MSAAMRILGLDPGLHLTGYGMIDSGRREPRLIEAGVLRVAQSGSLAARLVSLYQHAHELIKEHQPQAVSIEELYSHYQRPRIAILMAHARGVLLLAAGANGREIYSYSPTRVKKLTTGSGRASKQQMQLAVMHALRLNEMPQPSDVADALAIALCHHYVRWQFGREVG
jgi:crossover junction endodeoxyribonuclease RuvC